MVGICQCQSTPRRQLANVQHHCALLGAAAAGGRRGGVVGRGATRGACSLGRAICRRVGQALGHFGNCISLSVYIPS